MVVKIEKSLWDTETGGISNLIEAWIAYRADWVCLQSEPIKPPYFSIHDTVKKKKSENEGARWNRCTRVGVICFMNRDNWMAFKYWEPGGALNYKTETAYRVSLWPARSKTSTCDDSYSSCMYKSAYIWLFWLFPLTLSRFHAAGQLRLRFTRKSKSKWERKKLNDTKNKKVVISAVRPFVNRNYLSIDAFRRNNVHEFCANDFRELGDSFGADQYSLNPSCSSSDFGWTKHRRNSVKCTCLKSKIKFLKTRASPFAPAGSILLHISYSIAIFFIAQRAEISEAWLCTAAGTMGRLEISAAYNHFKLPSSTALSRHPMTAL